MQGRARHSFDYLALVVSWVSRVFGFGFLDLGVDSSRSPVQLPGLISFRNQSNSNKDLNGTEVSKWPDLLCSCRD